MGMLRLLFIRGLLGGVAMICVFSSLGLLAMSDSVVLVNTHPIWTSILAAYYLNEHLSKKSFFCILVSFSGMLVVARPASFFEESSTVNNNQLIGSMMGITGSVLISFVSIVLRKLGRDYQCPGAVHMQYNYIISVFVTSLLLIHTSADISGYPQITW